MTIIEFIYENHIWVTPIIIAVLSGIIAGVFKLFAKNGRVHKQKFGAIKKSKITNINGDYLSKKK